MADKIYFGLPGNVQVIPYPESGMGFDNTVDAEVTNLLSGGRSVFRPPTAFKAFNMSWKSNTAGLAPLLDMYNGEYGQGPFFMNDPTASQNNCLPARWANSWQLAHLSNGWCRPVVNSVTPTTGTPVATTPNTNKSVTFTQGNANLTSGVLKMRTIRVPGKAYWLAAKGSATNGTTRTNLITNPSSGTATTGYTSVAGTSGVAAVTRVTSGGSTTPTFSRVTWSTATTTVSGGVSYATALNLLGGQNHAISAWVRSSIAQTVTFSIDWKQGGGSYVSTTSAAPVALVANTWTQVFFTGACPSIANNGSINVLATAGGAVWPIGATLDIQGVMVETGSTLGLFFDGSFPSDTSVTHAWTGTANASTSTEVKIPGIKLRGFRLDTNVWEDITTFNVWTGVSTSILTTANTTYEMLELDFYIPFGASLTLSGMALSTVDLATVTPADWMPRGAGTGALQFTSAAQGSLVSTVVDRIGLTLNLTEVQNVESLMQ